MKFSAKDLIALIEEILNGKLHFLCSVRTFSNNAQVNHSNLRNKISKNIYWSLGFSQKMFCPITSAFSAYSCSENISQFYVEVIYKLIFVRLDKFSHLWYLREFRGLSPTFASYIKELKRIKYLLFLNLQKTLNSLNILFHDGRSYHIETSPLICSANQLTVFYVTGNLCHERVNRSEINENMNAEVIHYFLDSLVFVW